MRDIPFNRPHAGDRALEYLREAALGGHHSGDGPFTKRCRSWLENHFAAPAALLTTSCTHALEMAAILLDVGPGNEVILPSFTFVSTANAFALRGAIPVFADVQPGTLNLCPREVERKITLRTKAIVPVHYAGVGCDMDELTKLAADAGIPIVEDNAHGLFGEYRHEKLGTFGALSTLSFHETKNVSCGEGGALIVNDPALVERAEILREKGTNRSRFFRGQVDKYSWVDLGSSWLPSDLLAAVLLGNLDDSHKTQARRRVLWNRYKSELADWAGEAGVELPKPPPHCRQAYHLFHLMLPNLKERQALIAHLKSLGVHAVFHYQPLHTSDMGRKFGANPGDCPVTERAADCLLRLPFHALLSDDDQTRVIDAVKDFQIKTVSRDAQRSVRLRMAA